MNSNNHLMLFSLSTMCFPALFWSEWDSELSEEALPNPVLPSSPFRNLLPNLWLLSVWGCRAFSQSYLHALVQSLPALHMFQRHRHMYSTCLPTITMCSTRYQARTVLSWVCRYCLKQLRFINPTVHLWHFNVECIISALFLTMNSV